MRRLSTGGTGAVYLAKQHRLGDRLVAVKVIPLDGSSLGPQHEPLPSIEQRFVREGKLLGHLTHPHILPVHDAGSEDNLLYLIMQYAPDGSLMDALRGRGPQPLELPLPMPFALDLLEQVASALQYIHAHGIVHRDVKPSNILVHVESAGHWHVMLADFGIARAADSTAQQHLLAGTLAYMAPEQFRGFYSPASDQYALAVVAYLLLSGRLPFPGDAAAQVYGHMHSAPTPPRSYNPAIPPAAEEVILRALAKRPGARYPSVASFMDALRFAATSGQSTTRSGITAPLPPVPSAGTENAPSPFIVTPTARQTRAAESALPLVIAPPVRPQQPGTSTTEAEIPPNRALGVAMAGERADNEQKPATVRKRRAAALLTSLLLLLIALVAVYAFRGSGQFASGANQPPFKSMSGATAVAATDTATTSSQASSGGGPAATAVATATAGGAPNTPGTVPPAATAGAGGGSLPPANAAQVVSQPAAASAQAGQHYTMTTTFANTGTATWRSGYGLLCDTSHHPQSTCAAGTVIPFSGYSVAPGQRVTFTITLVAPAAPGVYASWWTLEQNGQPFGVQDVVMRVTVVPAASPTPSATATPTVSPTPTSAPTPTAPPGSSATPHSS